MIEFYWHRKLKLPVVFPFGTFVWRKIIGVRIGDYFFGMIKGRMDGE